VVAGVQTNQATASPVDPFTVLSSKDGFRQGDLVVGVQPGVGAAPASCVLHELTSTVGAAGNCGGATGGNQLGHTVGAYKNASQACAFVNARFNSSSGIKDSGGATVPALNQNTGGQIFNLGVPSLKAYAIRGGNLTSCDLLASDCVNMANYTVVINDIVSMRAVYGRDTTVPQDFQVDVWDRTPLPTLADASTVMAVMLQVTARSGLREKPSTGTTCDTHTDATRPDKVQDWLGQSVIGASIDLSTSIAGVNEWMCYRYRLYQTRVPIRNMAWRP
jgi:hypothetical protein